MTCSQNQTEVLWVPTHTHTHTNYTNYTNWLNIRSWIQLCTALVHPIFHTNIKAYCNITADSGNHYFTDDLLKTHTHTHTHTHTLTIIVSIILLIAERPGMSSPRLSGISLSVVISWKHTEETLPSVYCRVCRPVASRKAEMDARQRRKKRSGETDKPWAK